MLSAFVTYGYIMRKICLYQTFPKLRRVVSASKGGLAGGGVTVGNPDDAGASKYNTTTPTKDVSIATSKYSNIMQPIQTENTVSTSIKNNNIGINIVDVSKDFSIVTPVTATYTTNINYVERSLVRTDATALSKNPSIVTMKNLSFANSKCCNFVQTNQTDITDIASTQNSTIIMSKYNTTATSKDISSTNSKCGNSVQTNPTENTDIAFIQDNTTYNVDKDSGTDDGQNVKERYSIAKAITRSDYTPETLDDVTNGNIRERESFNHARMIIRQFCPDFQISIQDIKSGDRNNANASVSSIGDNNPKDRNIINIKEFDDNQSNETVTNKNNTNNSPSSGLELGTTQTPPVFDSQLSSSNKSNKNDKERSGGRLRKRALDETRNRYDRIRIERTRKGLLLPSLLIMTYVLFRIGPVLMFFHHAVIDQFPTNVELFVAQGLIFVGLVSDAIIYLFAFRPIRRWMTRKFNVGRSLTSICHS